jgi:hypothetical protein
MQVAKSSEQEVGSCQLINFESCLMCLKRSTAAAASHVVSAKHIVLLVCRFPCSGIRIRLP